jgi:hypothetical protein
MFYSVKGAAPQKSIILAKFCGGPVYGLAVILQMREKQGIKIVAFSQAILNF